MTDYEMQAKKFLEDCNATLETMYLGKNINENWDEKQKRDTYLVNIVTPRGNMQVKFWDSWNNTIKNTNRMASGRSRKKPSAYNILSCLTTYDVGDIEDFILEFGYEVKKRGDFTRIQNIYNAVKKEYEDVRRCFTEKQIEKLQGIV